MGRFLLRRVAAALAALWVLSAITFLLGAISPGSAVEIRLGQHADPAEVARLRREFGLDRPVVERYWTWIAGCLRGDFGKSFKDMQPVRDTLQQRYPLTLSVALWAALWAAVLGIGLGFIAALTAGTWADRAATSFAVAGVSMPTFVLLPLLVLLFSLRLRWFPVTYGDQWWHLLLPAAALGMRPAALLARVTRAALLESLGQDYVRTARAKGLGPGQTVLLHAALNAVLPVLTVLGTSTGYLLGGSFVVETIFGIRGVGEISIDAVLERDFPMVQAVTLLAATAFILVNLVVDVLYGVLDPRLRPTRRPPSPVSAG